MEKIEPNDLKKLKKFLDEIESQRRKPNYEISLTKLSGLLNRVGFEGPLYQKGSVRAFRHALLEPLKYLTNGQFTIHVIHGKENIAYKDFKKYMFDFIVAVIEIIGNQGYLKEESEGINDVEI